MKRLVVLAVAFGVALAIPAGAAGPTTQEVAAIVARHKLALERDQAAEDDCLRAPSPSPCDDVQARAVRATADAKDSLALATELEKAVGKNAQRAPKQIRSLANQTIKQGRTVFSRTSKWLTCIKSHPGRPASVCDQSFGYIENFFVFPTLLNRWSPYLH